MHITNEKAFNIVLSLAIDKLDEMKSNVQLVPIHSLEGVKQNKRVEEASEAIKIITELNLNKNIALALADLNK